jgi:hypothetical protein
MNIVYLMDQGVELAGIAAFSAIIAWEKARILLSFF